MSETVQAKQLLRLRDELALSPSLLNPDNTAFYERLVQRSGWGYVLTGLEKSFDQPSYPLPAQQHPLVLPEDKWHDQLTPHLPSLTAAAASVGRLDLVRDGASSFCGTGWLVRPDLVVTNRHIVAGLRDDLAQGLISLKIDFFGEQGNPATCAFPVTAVEWFVPHHDEPNLDLAFVRIDRAAGPAVDVKPLELAPSDDLEVGDAVCTIGFPAIPGQTYDADNFRLAFGGVFGVKRLSPGRVSGITGFVRHNCTTLGGSSGSPILDLETARVVAFNVGEDIDANLALPARVVRQHLAANFP